MIKKAIFLIPLYLLLFSTLHAQSLSEQMGGIKTHFQFYSLITHLNVSDQMLILRAENVHHAVDFTESAFGWGSGYRSFHLEFASEEELNTQTFTYKAGRDNDDKLKLTFYDANKHILASFPIPFERVNMYSGTNDKKDSFFYSIDLINVPLIILDKTAAIDMVKMVASRK